MSQTRLINGNRGPLISSTKPNTSREAVSILWHTLRRWWLLSISVGLVSAVGAAVLIFVAFRPEYRASMWLQIYANAPYIVFPEKDDSVQFIENQKQLIRSRLVLGPLVSDPQITALEELFKSDDKIDELANRLNVRPIGRSEYFAVEYRGIAEDTSKYVVQQVVNSYMSLRNSDEAKQRKDVIALLDGERVLREKKVEEIRETLAKLVESSPVTDGPMPTHSDEKMSNLAELRKRLVTLDVESSVLKIEIEALEASINNNSEQNMEQFNNLVDDHNSVISLETQIAKGEEELRAIRSLGLAGNHPVYRKTKEELDSQYLRLGEVREKVAKSQAIKSQIARKNEQGNLLAAMKSKLSSYQITQSVIESHLANETHLVIKSSGNSLKEEFLRAELNQATDVHNLISRRLLALRTEQGAPSRIQPLEAAGVNVIPVELIPYKKMALAAVGAFALPFSLFFVFELWMRKVFNVEQLEGTGHLRVISEISNLPRDRLSNHVRPRRWLTEKQLYRESVDHLRTCLVCQESENASQVLAINSAVSGEGKSSLAYELSVSLTSASCHRVLLIDGDMRHPRMHCQFATELSPGLTEVLEDKVDWKTAIRKCSAGRLHLLTAGELFGSPHRLLNNCKFKNLIAELRSHYTYIVIDTPPVLSASESLLMAKTADSFLLCARRDLSRLEHVRAAHYRLMLVGASCAGTVLTGIPFRNFTSRYGFYAYQEDSPVY